MIITLKIVFACLVILTFPAQMSFLLVLLLGTLFFLLVVPQVLGWPTTAWHEFGYLLFTLVALLLLRFLLLQAVQRLGKVQLLGRASAQMRSRLWFAGNSNRDAIDHFFQLGSMRDEAALFCRRGELETRGLGRELYAYAAGLLPTVLYFAWFFEKPTQTWSSRFAAWQEHIKRYAVALDDPDNKSFRISDQEETKLWEIKRKYLAERLRLLDAKFQMLLNVNGALLAVSGVMLKESQELANGSYRLPLFKVDLHDIAYKGLVLAAIMIIFGSLFNLSLIIKGFRRVTWGDFSIYSKDDHLFFLIVSLTKRTNWFRISARTTEMLLPLLILLVSFGAALFLLAERTSQNNPDNRQKAPQTHIELLNSVQDLKAGPLFCLRDRES